MKRLHRALLMPWAGGDPSMAYTNKVAALGPIAYFPLAETSGVTAFDASGNGRNGTYRNTAGVLNGITLGSAGIGDGRTSATFDGANGFVNIFTAGLASAFNGGEGTIVAWSAGTASAGTAQRQISLAVDGNNLVRIRWNASNGAVTFDYVAGGTAEQVVGAGAMNAGSAFACFALTWSISTGASGEMKAWKNGAQVGSTQTTLGTWAGSLASTLCTIAAADTSATAPFTGREAHAAIFGSALSAANLLAIATVP